MRKPSSQDRRDDALGLGGYGCLVTLVLLGSSVGIGLLLWGIGRVVRAGQAPAPTTGGEARSFLDSLEGSIALCGAGALATLVAIVAGVVLLKELSDDAARRQRGPVR